MWDNEFMSSVGVYYGLLKKEIDDAVSLANEIIAGFRSRDPETKLLGRKIFLFEDELFELKKMLSDVSFHAIESLLDDFDFRLNVTISTSEGNFSLLDLLEKEQGDIVGRVKKILRDLIENCEV